MNRAKAETIKLLYVMAEETPVVDSHTHIQDDIIGFDEKMAECNLAGTQAPFNRFPQHIVDAALAQNRLVRRTMMDPAHGLLYSWFAEVAEGNRGRLDEVIERFGGNNEAERKDAAVAILKELEPSRYSEYAEWLRIMFRLYNGVPDDIDPLDPNSFETVYAAVRAQRNDPSFAEQVLRTAKIERYVTSIENRDRIPLDPAEIKRPGDVDLSHATHPEAFNMFDANYIVWPKGATDFGLFFGGHKYEAERYLLNLEESMGTSFDNARQLRAAIHEFFRTILWEPKNNGTSRILYTDIFQPIDMRLSTPVDVATVNTILRYSKGSLDPKAVGAMTAFCTTAMLEALDEIGADIKSTGEEYGSCLQIAVGVTYFMDPAREIQSFPVYAAGFPQDEYPIWAAYPNVHFEYIVAHEGLYRDLAAAAKQVGNISVGPWWHFFHKDNIARMLVEQLAMGPVSSIASGFTDARFVEMAVAKYRSVRWGVAAALADLVDDPFSALAGNVDEAGRLIREILFDNPRKVHHLSG